MLISIKLKFVGKGLINPIPALNLWWLVYGPIYAPLCLSELAELDLQEELTIILQKSFTLKRSMKSFFDDLFVFYYLFVWMCECVCGGEGDSYITQDMSIHWAVNSLGYRQ